jgi:predicted nucleic acid-binding protein
MSIYLDACVIVPLFTADIHSPKAEAFFRDNMSNLVVSDLAAAEFSATISRKFRMRLLTAADAIAAFANFDLWHERAMRKVGLVEDDLAAAQTFVRRLDLTLLTPDALHMAVCQRLGATLATFDAKMAQAAQMLGLPMAKV